MFRKESSTQETEKVSDGDKRSVILLQSFPNRAETPKWKSSSRGRPMFRHRRQADRDKGQGLAMLRW